MALMQPVFLKNIYIQIIKILNKTKVELQENQRNVWGHLESDFNGCSAYERLGPLHLSFNKDPKTIMLLGQQTVLMSYFMEGWSLAVNSELPIFISAVSFKEQRF